MSDQPQAQSQSPVPSNHVPFFLKSLGWAIPTAAPTPASTSINETPPAANSTQASTMPDWDVSHMQHRSYDFELIGNLFPSHPDNQQPPTPITKGSKRKLMPFYSIHYLPELTTVQVNSLFTGILGNTKHWNAMTGFLQQKFTEGVMEGWEYQEWKEMCRSVKKVGGMDVKDREAFQRRFCNDFLLWFLAVDIRYGYEVTDEFAKMVRAPQVTLIFDRSLQFALYEVQWIDIDKHETRLSDEENENGEENGEEKKEEEETGESAKADEGSP